MSKIMRVYLDDVTQERLEKISAELCRSQSDLIDAAVAEAINSYWHSHHTGREPQRPLLLKEKIR